MSKFKSFPRFFENENLKEFGGALLFRDIQKEGMEHFTYTGSCELTFDITLIKKGSTPTLTVETNYMYFLERKFFHEETCRNFLFSSARDFLPFFCVFKWNPVMIVSVHAGKSQQCTPYVEKAIDKEFKQLFSLENVNSKSKEAINFLASVYPEQMKKHRGIVSSKKFNF